MRANGRSDGMFGWRPTPPREGTERPCEWPGCGCEGLHPAPSGRDHRGMYRWFCLEHIRIYNSSWNYYAGMTEAEIEQDIRRDTVWQRPSWPFGSVSPRLDHSSDHLRDPFGLFENHPSHGERERARAVTVEERALLVLDLRPPVTVAIVKARYKELVKRYHPDATGGDKVAEERFKRISEAYRTVMNGLST